MKGDMMDPILAEAEAVPSAEVRWVVGKRSLVKTYPAPKATLQGMVPVQASTTMPRLPEGKRRVPKRARPASSREKDSMGLRPNLEKPSVISAKVHNIFCALTCSPGMVQ